MWIDRLTFFPDRTVGPAATGAEERWFDSALGAVGRRLRMSLSTIGAGMNYRPSQSAEMIS